MANLLVIQISKKGYVNTCFRYGRPGCALSGDPVRVAGLLHPAAIAQHGQTGALFCILKITGHVKQTLSLRVMRSRAVTSLIRRKEPLQNTRLSVFLHAFGSFRPTLHAHDFSEPFFSAIWSLHIESNVCRLGQLSVHVDTRPHK
jgi:hypothetical protein